MNSVLNSRAVSKWEIVMQEESVSMLRHLLKEPERFSKHLRRSVSRYYV